jgi:hypothetical protein
MGQNPGTLQHAVPVETLAIIANRASALGKALGPEEGWPNCGRFPIPPSSRLSLLSGSPGEFHLLAGRPAEAEKHFEKP